MEHKIHESGASGAVYGLGFIGAAVYFISTCRYILDGRAGVFESHSLASLSGLRIA